MIQSFKHKGLELFFKLDVNRAYKPNM